MTARPFAALLAIALADCHDHRDARSPGGELAGCPGALLAAPSIALTGGAPGDDVQVVTSAEALQSAAGGLVARETSARSRDGYAIPTPNERGLLESFLRETDFATQDVAVVRAGGERNRVAGIETGAAGTRIFLSPTCSPCGGGNPGSYYAAQASREAEIQPWTALVRVKKGASVTAETCSTAPCGQCPSDVP